jgi:hypothetical protein
MKREMFERFDSIIGDYLTERDSEDNHSVNHGTEGIRSEISVEERKKRTKHKKMVKKAKKAKKEVI